MTTITAPGIYADFQIDAYHTDPCPRPSLNQSLAKVLLDRSPRHAWLQHPRLNPDWEPDHDKKFNIGNAAHRLLLGRGRDFEVFNCSDWNATGGGKGAKTNLHLARDKALTEGKLPILKHQVETAAEMEESCRAQLGVMMEREFWDAFVEGQGEVVIACEHRGFWYRSMIDWMVSPTVLFDYKSTAASAAPGDIPIRLMSGGWDVQAAMQEFILDQIEPDMAGRRKHYFVCQENEPPYALTVTLMPEAVMTMGRLKLSAAMETWKRCLTEDRWPAYGSQIVSPEYPNFAEAKWMERLMGSTE